ncbi:hypothetical protein [Raineyella fluvialis]|uniref:hypothetical protein n=1 Tax=Raineyella fluvialis TaxID=2662261 RepID=UPI00188F7612|nr:hypothetical protein [Raineyella fluvialis]
MAAKASNGPAAPDFDKALVQLSAKEREAGQQTRAEQAAQANTELEQDKRTVDQAGAATNIRSEQARLVDEKKKAEAAAALLKAQQDALAAAKQSASSASNATSAGSVTLPDGTLVRPSADGTWPPRCSLPWRSSARR